MRSLQKTGATPVHPRLGKCLSAQSWWIGVGFSDDYQSSFSFRKPHLCWLFSILYPSPWIWQAPCPLDSDWIQPVKDTQGMREREEREVAPPPSAHSCLSAVLCKVCIPLWAQLLLGGPPPAPTPFFGPKGFSPTVPFPASSGRVVVITPPAASPWILHLPLLVP